METVAHKDYRTLLREELEARCQRNPRYSLRSFARDLKLPPAQLSDVLRGRYGLSRVSAEKIARRLGWSERERMVFCELVDCTHARSRLKKVQAQERLKGLLETQEHSLTLDAFQVISDWYHYALLELTLVRGFKSDRAWIAKRLGVSEHVVAAAIERLKRLELLDEVDGKLRARDELTTMPAGIPNEAIKKFHKQVLEKALAAITLQTTQERDLSAMVVAVDRTKLPEAKEWIKKFRRDFNSHFGNGPDRNEVYCLGVQFFRFEERGENV